MRLIDADALTIKLNKIPECDFYEQTGNPFNYAKFLDVFTAVKNAPTIEKRKKGKWIKISPAGIYECSVCGQNVMTQDIDAYLYCHGCGADMRGTP